MPADHSWDEKSRILRTRLWGHVTNQDLIRNALKCFENPRIRSPLQELVDLREVKSTEVTIEGLRSTVQLETTMADRFRGERKAIVAPTDELRCMAQTFITLSDVHRSPHRIRVFGTLAEAEEWLVSPDSEGMGFSAVRPPPPGR